MKEKWRKKYDWVGYFSEGRAGVKRNGLWGFVDLEGREVIECKYDDVGDFSEGRAEVERNGLWGFVDLEGRDVIECKYDDVYSFREGRAGVKRNGLWGFVNREGNESGFPEVKKKIKKVNKYQLFVREYMKV